MEVVNRNEDGPFSVYEKSPDLDELNCLIVSKRWKRVLNLELRKKRYLIQHTDKLMQTLLTNVIFISGNIIVKILIFAIEGKMMLRNILPLNHKNFVNTRKGRKTLSSWVSEEKGIDSKYELQEEMMLSKS